MGRSARLGHRRLQEQAFTTAAVNTPTCLEETCSSFRALCPTLPTDSPATPPNRSLATGGGCCSADHLLVVAGVLIFSIDWDVASLATFIGALFMFEGLSIALTSGIDGRVRQANVLTGLLSIAAGVAIVVWPTPGLVVNGLPRRVADRRDDHPDRRVARRPAHPARLVVVRHPRRPGSGARRAGARRPRHDACGARDGRRHLGEWRSA